jgi:4-carboxymuconolactone decarboxylase
VDPVSESAYRALFVEETDSVGPVKNVMLTWARHPDLLRAQRPLQRYLYGGCLLPPADQELAILRIGWLCRAEYEFGHHTVFGLAAGLSDLDVQRVTEGPEAPGWTRAQSTVLRAVDDLYCDQMISAATWDSLGEQYGTQQIMDLLALVGRYWTVSAVLNSLGVQREDGVPGFQLHQLHPETSWPGANRVTVAVNPDARDRLNRTRTCRTSRRRPTHRAAQRRCRRRCA